MAIKYFKILVLTLRYIFIKDESSTGSECSNANSLISRRKKKLLRKWKLFESVVT